MNMKNTFDRYVAAAMEITLLSQTDNRKVSALYSQWCAMVMNYSIKVAEAGEKQDTNAIIRESNNLINKATRMKDQIGKMEGWSYTKEIMTRELDSKIAKLKKDIEKLES